jgi:addiction module HigA family antidote
MRNSSDVKRIPPHPGRVMSQHYMAPRALSVDYVVKESGLKRQYVERVLKEKADINNDTAPKFAKAFGTTPAFWKLLQDNRNSYVKRTQQREKEHAERVSKAVAAEEQEIILNKRRST